MVKVVKPEFSRSEFIFRESSEMFSVNKNIAWLKYNKKFDKFAIYVINN